MMHEIDIPDELAELIARAYGCFVNTTANQFDASKNDFLREIIRSHCSKMIEAAPLPPPSSKTLLARVELVRRELLTERPFAHPVAESDQTLYKPVRRSK
jgi:hypothetical protein